MPKMLLSDDSTIFYLEILNYTSSKKAKGRIWCDVRIKIKNKYLNFDSTSEYLDNYEVEWLAEYLKKLLNGEITEEEEINFIEPEINFKPSLPWDQYPDGEKLIYVSDGVLHHPLILDIIIDFCSNGCYCGERWSVPLDQDEIQDFYDQLIKEMEICDCKPFIVYKEQAEIVAQRISDSHEIPLSNENINKISH